MFAIHLFKGIKRIAVEPNSINPAETAEACEYRLSFLSLKLKQPISAGRNIDAKQKDIIAEETAGLLFTPFSSPWATLLLLINEAIGGIPLTFNPLQVFC